MYKYIPLMLVLLALGWLAHDMWNYGTITGYAVASPGNWLDDDKITVLPNYVVLNIPNATLAVYADTGSMDPVLGASTKGVEVEPEKKKIKVGDIISYKSKSGVIIVHRVVEIGMDNEGEYYLVKGDNNPVRDEERVRFEQIQGVLVGLVY